MADETKITQEDVQAAQDIATALQEQATNTKELLNLTVKVGKERKKLLDILKEELGKQAEYVAEIDARKRLSDELLADKERELEQLKELQEIEKSIARLQEQKKRNATELAQFTKQIKDEKKKAPADRDQALIAKLLRQKRLQRSAQTDLNKELNKQIVKRDKINALNLETSDVIKQQMKDEAENNVLLEQRSKTQENIRSIVGRQVEETFGLKDATDSVSDALIDTLFNADSAAERFEGIKDLITATADEMAKRFTFKMLTKRVSAFGNDFKDQLLEVSKKVEDLDVVFTRQTGLAARFGDQIESAVLPLVQQGLLIEETTMAFGTLSQSMINFTEVSDAQRIALSKNAALLSRLGVDTVTFGQAVEGITMNMGMSADQAIQLTGEIVNFGRELNVGANKILQQFNQSLTLFATYGATRGAEIFKELAVTAKRAGIEMSTLVEIGKRFDTFEGAMRSAGKLNFILGGPFVNSMEMLNATEERRIELLRESLKLSGKTFDEFSRRGREALANALGTSVEITQRLFNDKSLKSAKEAAAAIDANKKSLEELAEEGLDKLTIDQRMQLATEKSLATNKKLVEVLGELQVGFAEIREFFAEISGFVGTLVVAFNTLGTTLTAVTGLMAAVGITGTGAFAAIALPVIAAITLIAALSYTIYELMTNTEEAMAGVKYMAGFVGSFLADIFFFLAELIAYAIDAIIMGIQEILSYFSELFGFGKMDAYNFEVTKSTRQVKADILGGVGLAGDSLTGDNIGFSPGAFSGQMKTRGAQAFANGTNFAGGGLSLVGERGPEFMNVPQGSQVVPAIQTEKMIKTLSTFNEIVTNSADTITNITNNNMMASGGGKERPIDMKLDVVMDGEVIGNIAKRIAREESENTISRALEVTA